MTAAITEPKEKKTDRAVTRYCLPLGICSSKSVPSVGMEPYTGSPSSVRVDNILVVDVDTHPDGASEQE